MSTYDPFNLDVDEVFFVEEPPYEFGGSDLSGTIYSVLDCKGKEFSFLIPDCFPDQDESDRIEVYEKGYEKDVRSHILVDVVSLDRNPTMNDLSQVANLWVEERNREIRPS